MYIRIKIFFKIFLKYSDVLFMVFIRIKTNRLNKISFSLLFFLTGITIWSKDAHSRCICLTECSKVFQNIIRSSTPQPNPCDRECQGSHGCEESREHEVLKSTEEATTALSMVSPSFSCPTGASCRDSHTGQPSSEHEIGRIAGILKGLKLAYEEKKVPGLVSCECNAQSIVNFVEQYKGFLEPETFYLRGWGVDRVGQVDGVDRVDKVTVPCSLKVFKDGTLVIYPCSNGIARGTSKTMDYAFEYATGKLVARLKLKGQRTLSADSSDQKILKEINITNRASEHQISLPFLDSKVGLVSKPPEKLVDKRIYNELVVNPILTQRLFLGGVLTAEIENSKNRMKRGEQPQTDERLRQLAYQLVRKVDQLHRLGIVHLDIKPDNIGKDEKGNVYLLDFGTAEEEIAEKLDSGKGSLGYMSPERFGVNAQLSNGADTWAVGVVLLELFHPEKNVEELFESRRKGVNKEKFSSEVETRRIIRTFTRADSIHRFFGIKELCSQSTIDHIDQAICGMLQPLGSRISLETAARLIEKK